MSLTFPARRRTPPPSHRPSTTLFDTGGLLTLAVDAGLWNLAVSRFSGTARTVVAVVKELEHLRKDTNVGGLATAALADLAWLGDPIVLDEDAGGSRPNAYGISSLQVDRSRMTSSTTPRQP